MNYGAHSRDYLYRARQRLDEQKPEALFYAAFELRCGIEARMEEYLEAQKHISKKKKKGWRIADLSKNIEAVFQSGDNVIAFIVHNETTREILHEFYYTPVNSGLRKMGEQLGNHLHSMKRYKPEEDQWWSDLRETLEQTYEELRKANIGTMLGAPLLDPKTNTVRFTSEVRNGESAEDILEKLAIGRSVVVQVRYLDDVPAHVK
jgi:hypothetical protein